MKDDTTAPYPGSMACVAEIIALADEYLLAALTLFENGRRREPLSIAPARLCSIQAIELYLNALLIHSGVPQKEIRGHLHDLAGMSDKAAIHGLKLKEKTDRHLKEMTLRREYLIARYGPELASVHTERNRVTATLDEVAKKVKRHVE